jgi:hypothetical protein
VGVTHPVLQQMQRNTEGDTEFFIKTKLFEAEKVFANVFSKVTSDELLATIVESTSTPIAGSAVQRGAKKFSIVGAHPIVQAGELSAQTFDVVLDIGL